MPVMLRKQLISQTMRCFVPQHNSKSLNYGTSLYEITYFLSPGIIKATSDEVALRRYLKKLFSEFCSNFYFSLPVSSFGDQHIQYRHHEYGQ